MRAHLLHPDELYGEAGVSSEIWRVQRSVTDKHTHTHSCAHALGHRITSDRDRVCVCVCVRLLMCTHFTKGACAGALAYNAEIGHIHSR